MARSLEKDLKLVEAAPKAPWKGKVGKYDKWIGIHCGHTGRIRVDYDDVDPVEARAIFHLIKEARAGWGAAIRRALYAEDLFEHRKKMDDAELEGMAAFLDGKGEDQNPFGYPTCVEEDWSYWYSWQQGWDGAKDDKELEMLREQVYGKNQVES